MRRLTAALTLVVLAVIAVPGSAAAAPPDVTAEGAVLWEPVDDRVLWSKQAQRPLRPASTTKIMTVLLALEAGAVDDTVTVSSEAVSVGATAGAATLGLSAGQRIPMRSLLQGLLLRSGNDAAVAVAEHISGSEAAFVEKMNARAAELGLDDTNFINATGLTDDPDHHSSALDLARLADVAMRNDDFADWASADTLAVEDLGVLENRNELIGTYPGANGVKTGYTALAGLCLVASAQRGARPLIAVVLDSDDSTSQGSFLDAAAILNHGFDDYRLARPLREGEAAVRYRWSDGSVPVVAQEPLARTVRSGRSATWSVQLEPAVQRPVEAGTAIGEATLTVGDRVVDSTPLIAARPVAAPAGTAERSAGGAVADALRAFARTAIVQRDA